MANATVALGSNLGDSVSTLAAAIERLDDLGLVVAVSSAYQSAPVGGPEQADFINLVCLMTTELAPHEFLLGLHEIEAEYGRERAQLWGARTLDLDLILYDDVVSANPKLLLPHPRALERRFVLEPLVEIAPDVTFPGGESASKALLEVQAQAVTNIGQLGTLGGGGERMHSRGVWWVVGQLILFVLISRTSLRGDWPIGNAWTGAVGWVLVAVGGGFSVLAMLNLNTSLTPFPKPMEGARLIDTGIYGLVRHPIYGALVVGAIGLSIARGSGLALLLSLLLLGYFSMEARHEERMLSDAYPEYAQYEQRVPKRFLPFLI